MLDHLHRLLFIFFIIVIPLFLVVAFYSYRSLVDLNGADAYAYHLVQDKSNPWPAFGVSDADHNGYSEIYNAFNALAHTAEKPQNVEQIDHQGIIRRQWNFPGVISDYLNFFDADEDGTEELAAWTIIGDTAFIDIRTLDDEVLARFPAVVQDRFTRIQNDNWDCHGYLKAFCDINADGQRELIFAVCTFYACSPRGLYVFSYPTGTLVWKAQMGAALTNIGAADIDRDSLPEIIIGCSTPENLREPINGTMDDKPYFMVYDHTGECMYSRILGSNGSIIVPFLVDIDHDGSSECIVLQNSYQKTAESQPSMVFLYDSKTSTLKPLAPPLDYRFHTYQMDDFDNDGMIDLLLVDSENMAFIYSFSPSGQNLRMVKKNRLSTPPMQINVLAKSIDLDRDGQKEIILECTDGTCVLNTDLQPLAYRPQLWNTRVLLRGKETPLLVGNKFGMAGYEVVRFEKNPSYTMRRMGAILPALSMLLLALCFFMILTLAGQLLRFSLTEKRTDVWLIMDKKLQVSKISGPLANLLGIRNLPVSQSLFTLCHDETAKSIQELFDRYLTSKTLSAKEMVFAGEKPITMNLDFCRVPGFCIRKKWVVFFSEVQTPLMDRLFNWMSVARALSHNLKNPLTAISSLVGHLRRDAVHMPLDAGEHLEEMQNRILEAKNANHKLLNFFDAWSRKPRPCDLDALIESIVQNLYGQFEWLPHIRLNLAGNLPLCRASHDLLRMAIENILHNAIEATGAEGEIVITTSCEDRVTAHAKSSQSLTLEIMDNGKGMTEEELARLFTPSLSGKAGGSGVGLIITREILNWYHGSLDISSRAGIGTIVTIEIPLKSEAE